MGLKNVKISLPQISKELEKTNASREFLIKNNREVIINCSQAIIAIHKNDLKSAKLKIKKAKSLLAKLKQKTTGDLNRYILTPEQELVEAVALLSIIEGKQIPTYKSIKVSGESYILGLLDCIGELKRQVIDQIRIGNSKNAEKYFEIFEKVCSQKQNSPNFVVSILCSTVTNLERKGLDSSLLDDEQIMETFGLLEQGKINKESIEIIFEQIMSRKANNALQALEKASITQLTDNELDKILDEIIQKNMNKVKDEQLRALSGLMGIAMKEVRGKASGKIINQKLKDKIQTILDKQ